MKFYEIDDRLRYIESALEPDENGEFSLSIDEMVKLDEEGKELLITRQEKLENLTKWYFNLLADAKAYESEFKRLKDHADSCKKKADNLKSYIGYICNGQKTNLGVATGSYRKTQSLSISDAAEAIKYLESNGHKDCVKYTDPEVRKDDVKALIKDGITVPGTELIENSSFSIR